MKLDKVPWKIVVSVLTGLAIGLSTGDWNYLIQGA